MSDDNVGYRRPPVHTRFRAGVSGNPKGRPRQQDRAAADIIHQTLNGEGKYRERGKLKTAPRWQINVLYWMNRALKGDVEAALLVLHLREESLKRRVASPVAIEIEDWLPDRLPHSAGDNTNCQFEDTHGSSDPLDPAVSSEDSQE